MRTEKIGRLQNARPSHKLRRDKRDRAPAVPYVGWMRFYKVIAVIGVVAVMLPYISLLFIWGARRYAAILSFFATVAMVSLGYLIQLLLLGRDRDILKSAWDFSYESKRLRLPLFRVIPACVLSAVAAGGIALLCEQIVSYLLRNEYRPGMTQNEEVGIPLLVAGFILTAVAGCLLVPFRPHQLLSTRTMIEFFALLAFPMAFDSFWGGGATTPTITVCTIVYILCMSVVMNQEAIIRPAHSSDTCVATHAIRRAGLVSVVGFVLRSVCLTVPVLGVVSLIVCFFRGLLTGGQFEKTFDFPFSGYPVLNAILCGVTLIILFVVAIFYSMKRTPAERAAILAKLSAWWERLVDFILTKLGIRDSYAAGLGRYEPPPKHFTDTVTAAPASESAPQTYRAFAKKVKSIKDTDERFCFAWRTMVVRLCAARRDLSPALTPLEMAAILSRTTTVRDIDRLTALFSDITYAEDDDIHATEADVGAVMAILEERW